ncbi:MAG: TonB-dependent receptor plug domain-containing protein, partial [Flavisolibacter sp.]
MRKFLLLSVALTLLAAQMWAQQRTVTGKVTDDKGTPIPNVSVTIKGTRFGTATKADGTYSITVPPNSRALIFSFSGMDSQEIVIGEENIVNTTLSLNANTMESVVVVGYGTQKRKESVANVASVKGATIANKPVQSFDQALAGRATGVQISVPNGVLNTPPVFRIRGTNSISLSSYPLIVVDGVPSFSGDFSSTSAASNALASINPNDIESIDIAKDAAATAIYGSAAANGVV